ncbi:MAG: YetF domain-containing protein [Thermodesulfobacteriota bacterium]
MSLSMFTPEVQILEKIVRPLIVYFFLLIAFRLAGKRELGQMTPFDLIVLLTISNVLQNAMIGPDNSLTGGLIGGLTLFCANGLIGRLTIHFPRIARLLEGKPTPLIEDGKVLAGNLRHEVMTPAELERAIRKHELDPETDLGLIKRALLEQDGTVTILHKMEPDQARHRKTIGKLLGKE